MKIEEAVDKALVGDSDAKVKKMNMLGQMAFGMIHDIRNSLQILRASSTMIRRQSQEPALLKNVDTIDAVIESTTHMAERVLSFSNKSEASVAEIDLSAVLDETVALSEYLLPAHVTIDYREPTNAMPMMGNTLELSHALLNLIKNASDAIESMHVQGRIVVGVRQCFPWIELKVSDNGCGIAEDKIQHIFDPLFTTKRNGTGLGLANVMEAVQNHGGIISVSSRQGEGTEFTIMLPLKG